MNSYTLFQRGAFDLTSPDLAAANARLHDYAVTHNRERREREWQSWTVRKRNAARLLGWTMEHGWVLR